MEQVVEYFLQNHDKLLYLIAGLSFVLELAVMGLSSPLLFFAIGSAVTGVVVSLGLISSWEHEVFCVGVVSVFTAVLLWKPLKKFQGPRQIDDTSSDMIGQVVPVSADVTAVGGNVRHSGLCWAARLDNNAKTEVIKAGEQVEITATEGTIMIVKEV